MELKYCPKAGGLENVLPEVRFWQCSFHEQHLPKLAMLACAALPEQPLLKDTSSVCWIALLYSQCYISVSNTNVPGKNRVMVTKYRHTFQNVAIREISEKGSCAWQGQSHVSAEGAPAVMHPTVICDSVCGSKGTGWIKGIRRLQQPPPMYTSLAPAQPAT